MAKTTTNLPVKPRISNVIVDTDLDMGIHDIRANEVRAARVYSPIDTDEWLSAELDWGDTAPSTNVMSHVGLGFTSGPVTIINLPVTANREHEITITHSGGLEIWTAALYKNETKIGELSEKLKSGASHTYPKFPIESGDVIQIRGNSHQAGTGYIDISIKNTGKVVGETVLSLNDKWLALGIDLKGLAATVKIQGVEMPYTDYPKYFPIAPTELKIPGAWSPDQVRPVIEVYT